ncbi:hypothetical protein [Dechloromonas denitrificans]|uniref:hypothetical protein n=1 Tax=Dechloromonas denitrificans TaxID=281362 RepID=UPI0030840F0D
MEQGRRQGVAGAGRPAGRRKTLFRGGFMDWLKKRAVEPSTWRGLGWVLVAAGVIPPGSVDALIGAGVALVGLVEVIRKEKA